MSETTLLSVDAAIEGATALALMVFPGVVIWLLFAAELPVIGTVLARLVGGHLARAISGLLVGAKGPGRDGDGLDACLQHPDDRVFRIAWPLG